MAQLKYPETDRTRLNVLEKCVDQSAKDRVKARLYVVPAPMETMVQTFLAQYRPAVEHMLNMRGNRSMEVDEKRTAVSELERHIRDFWAVLERRIVRKNLPRGMFVEFDQLRSGENPDGRSLQEWLNRAEDIIRGEARVVAKGYEPMANPSVAEITAVRDAALAEAADVEDAISDLDQAQHDLDALRPEADRLIRLFIAQLDITLYGVDKDDIRAIKERYGYTFYVRETEETAVVQEPLAPITPAEEPPA